MRNEHDANDALFMASLDRVCAKVTARSARENKARANAGSAEYWRKQHANRKANALSWDALTKWISC